MGVSGKGEIRVLTLEHGVDGSSTLYRLQPSWTLLFQLGPSLFGQRVTLWSNYPSLNGGSHFVRTAYNEIPWEIDGGGSVGAGVTDDTCKVARLSLHTSGSFHYYLKDER